MGEKYFDAYHGMNKDEPGTPADSNYVGPQHLDFKLAAYVIAENITSLDIHKWKLCFDVEGQKDEEVQRVFQSMRDRYLVVYPTHAGVNGWSNIILGYLKSLFTVTFVKGVSYLFLLQLLGNFCIKETICY